LVLVGDGPDRDRAEEEVDRAGLRADVRFLGKVDRVAELLRGADLLLLPSEIESFGLAALEAMACGVPVLASRAGGLPEVVVDGETGYLLPPGAVAAFAERAIAVLRDPALHARLRSAAAAHALAFSPQRVVPRYEALYRELVGGWPAAPGARAQSGGRRGRVAGRGLDRAGRDRDAQGGGGRGAGGDRAGRGGERGERPRRPRG